ncbi:hypothetical protein [Xanthobacter autotrophicus]
MGKKIILVTGSSSGFGRLTAEALGRRGARAKGIELLPRRWVMGRTCA